MGILNPDSLPLQTLSFSHILLLALGASVLYLISYVIYQRCFHPLARFPGPVLASLTDLWQVHQFCTLKQPYRLTELHTKYGQFVRYGPDKLSITAEDVIAPVYQKGGRNFPKTEFYDAYGAQHPNVFGMRDESVSDNSSYAAFRITESVLDPFSSKTPYVS